MQFNPKEFGELLKALRGNQTQVAVSEASGISQSLISSYELGDTDNPSFVVLTKLANHYGVTPNIMAALAGLHAEPGTEEDMFAPNVARTLQTIYTLMIELGTASKQARLAAMLDTVVFEMKRIADRDDAIISTKLPAYVKHILTSDGASEKPVRRQVKLANGAMRAEEVIEDKE